MVAVAVLVVVLEWEERAAEGVVVRVVLVVVVGGVPCLRELRAQGAFVVVLVRG